MATINGLAGASAGVPFIGTGKHFVLTNTVDLDALNVASGDTVQAIPVSAGMRILLVETEVVTASDAATSATLDVGDGDNSSGYDTGINIKSVGINCTAIGIDPFGASGKRYTADDTIDVTPTYTGAVTVKGKITVRAIGVKVA